MFCIAIEIHGEATAAIGHDSTEALGKYTLRWRCNGQHSVRFCNAAATIQVSERCGCDDWTSMTARMTQERIEVGKPTAMNTPVYYSLATNRLVLTSHLRELRREQVDLALDEDAVGEYLVYRHVMPPRTLCSGVCQIPTGGRLMVDARRSLVLEGVEHLRFNNQPSLQMSEGTRALIDELGRIVSRIALEPDDLMVLLSGGIDSSILARMCQLQWPHRRLSTYSSGYPFEDNDLNDERQYALSAAALLGSTHTYHEGTTAEYLLALIDAIDAAEIPLHHLQSVCLFALMRRYPHKAVLNGVGAGGIFGNFRNFLFSTRGWKKTFLANGPMLRLQRVAVKAWGGRGRYMLQDLHLRWRASSLPLGDEKHPIWDLGAYGDRKWAARLTNASVIQQRGERERYIGGSDWSSLEEAWAMYSLAGDEHETRSIWSKLAEGAGCLLVTPFYDDTVLDIAMSIPWRQKLRRPENRLRKTMALSVGVPETIVFRPKRGFGVRSRTWAEPGGALYPLLPFASGFGVDPAQLLTGTPGDAMCLWNLVNLGIWKRIVIEDEPKSTVLADLGR